jgi:hypothetical protein
MSIRKHHRMMAAVSAVVATVGVILPSTAAASPMRSSDLAISAQQTAPMARAACVKDGVAEDGREVGANPYRYKFDGSPYLGVRWDQCGDSITLYYGGTSGMTHYNLRDVHGSQIRLRNFANGQLRFPPPRERSYWWIVQACKEGGVFTKTSCTRWSPAVAITFN